MKLLGIVLILGGLGGILEGRFILGLLLIVVGYQVFKKHRNIKPSSKENGKRERKRLNTIKINELENRRASIKFNVAGVTYENRQRLLGTIVRRYGSEGIGNIQFIPEPNNKYDPNAIKIIFEDVGHIGYVPKERAVNIGESIDKNIYDIKWNLDYYSSDNENDEGVVYMEIRLYTQK